MKNHQNNKTSILSILKVVLSRTIVLFAAFYCILIWTVDYRHIEQGYQARVLNMVRPSFTPLYDFLENKNSADNKILMQYAKYYTKVAEFIPQNAETQGMLGLSFYYMKGYNQAYKAFEKASVLNRNLFWSRYNSGVILFKSKKYQEAFKKFEEALATSAGYNLKLMEESKIYLQLAGDVVDQEGYFKRGLQKGYHNAFVGIVLSAFNTNDFKNVFVYSKIATTKSVAGREGFVFLSGYAAFRLNDFVQAEEFLKESLVINPKNTAAKKMLATILKARGQDAESEGLLNGISEEDLRAPNKIELGDFDVMMF